MLSDQLEAMREAAQELYVDPRIPATRPKKAGRWRWRAPLIVTAVLAVTVLSRQSYAVFGVGDVVFDPSAYATLGHIWSQDISNYAKLAQTVTQLLKIYQDGLAVHQLADEMRVGISHPSSMLPVAYSVAGNVTENKLGETVDWGRVMNSHSSPEEVAAAWKQSTRQIDSDLTPMQGDGSDSQRRADLATIQIVDGASKSCMQNVGSYRSGNQLNQLVRNILKRYRLADGNSMGQGSYMAQYQLMNIGGEQELNERLAGNAMAVCETELKIADMKLKRDEAAARVQTSLDYDKGKTMPSYNDPNGSVDALRSILP